jgi:hypothetical protein
VHGEVMYPDDEDGDINGEDAEHEDEDGVGVVVEIMMGPRTLSNLESCTFAHR